MIRVGAIYRHFKGHLYEVVGECTHSETLEKMVVYKDVDTGLLWVRPIDMFLSKVDKDKYPDIKQKYRFEEVTKL